ncbi:hypothetical protein C8R45DRAFT_918884 [Mycena sanguinolenta]|nr:hypothetical protein C8R45DRAFT_918884 [Mycena sanguinolenta]
MISVFKTLLLVSVSPIRCPFSCLRCPSSQLPLLLAWAAPTTPPQQGEPTRAFTPTRTILAQISPDSSLTCVLILALVSLVITSGTWVRSPGSSCLKRREASPPPPPPPPPPPAEEQYRNSRRFNVGSVPTPGDGGCQAPQEMLSPHSSSRLNLLLVAPSLVSSSAATKESAGASTHALRYSRRPYSSLSSQRTEVSTGAGAACGGDFPEEQDDGADRVRRDGNGRGTTGAPEESTVQQEIWRRLYEVRLGQAEDDDDKRQGAEACTLYTPENALWSEIRVWLSRAKYYVRCVPLEPREWIEIRFPSKSPSRDTPTPSSAEPPSATQTQTGTYRDGQTSAVFVAWLRGLSWLPYSKGRALGSWLFLGLQQLSTVATLPLIETPEIAVQWRRHTYGHLTH